MNCLCCGKPLHSDPDGNGWHRTCIRRFFKTTQLPELDMDEHTLELLAIESTNKGYTVPGVQKKLSLHFFSDGKNPRLTLLNYPTGYILKPQVEEFEALPEAEQLVMCMADTAGISTVPHALIRGKDNFVYITRRVDREAAGEEMKMLAMEDFCQLELRLTQDKYRGSYERCAGVIHRYSSRSGLDMTELFMRLVFSFVVGNSDMHLKNFSLIETEENSGRYQLSPAYDLLPVQVIMPEDPEQFALTMNGKKQNLHRKDFLIFAQKCGIPQVSAEKMLAKILSMEAEFKKMCGDSFLPAHLKERFVHLMEQRFRTLKK